jgi:4-alpha-glucanotransferase
MRLPRSSGILLHPTSLPGRFGIGDLGPEAHRFLDFLAETRQGVWQVLPLGPTGFGDSPYQSFSAFAGNPLLISPELLVAEGWLPPESLRRVPRLPASEVDYGATIALKTQLLRRAFERFAADAPPGAREGFAAFRRDHAHWLGEFALFMALKQTHGGAPWSHWEEELANRRPEAMERARRELNREVEFHELAQYLFHRQWSSLRAAAHRRGVRFMGDIPIFVAHDSADVWSHPELFALAGDRSPAAQAGVPPDYFSATGQLWGNPLYRWEVLARTGYAWWVDRFRAVLALVDFVRLDHFRGFEAYWEVPGGDRTAERGRWVKGPGAALFEALEKALGPLPVVAENLGVITPEVEALRQRFGFPGMAILQFAFGNDPAADSFKPHNYPQQLVAYTGTHDNDTTLGWWSEGTGHSTRKVAEVRQERACCRRYLDCDGRSIHWDFIRAIQASVAGLAVVPLQDLLGLGSAARMNRPGSASGNWTWRFRSRDLSRSLRGRLRELTTLYGRAAPESEPPATR